MTNFHCTTIFSLLFFLSVAGQTRKEVAANFELVKDIVTTEILGNNLVHRLDSLKAKFGPSKSPLTDRFNRDIDYGFKHRRISVFFNSCSYSIDLLCRHDTIFLSYSTSAYKEIEYVNYNKEVIGEFLKRRNNFYHSSKTVRQLVKELSIEEEYAFYCGDGNPKTEKGMYIEQLVEEENEAVLTNMLKSFNCETQAYGVAGLEMLERRDYELPSYIQNIVSHIKNRNSDLIVCSGCLSGLIDKIYTEK